MKKRSITLLGHRTSITLEDEFWTELKEIAVHEGVSVNALIARIDDAGRGSGQIFNLSSALRVYVLKAAKSGR